MSATVATQKFHIHLFAFHNCMYIDVLVLQIKVTNRGPCLGTAILKIQTKA